MGTSRPNQSLQRGLRCLQMLAAAGRPIGSREMARELGLEHTRVHRVLGTLEMLGLAALTEDGKYRPGPALHVLAAQSLRGSRLLAAGLARLRGLHSSGLTVALGVLWQGQVCYLIHARPGQTLDEGIGSHELWPAENSSLGAVLLAAEGGRMASPSAERLAPETPAPLAERRSCLREVRKCGNARLRYPDGTLSLAVPVGDPVIAAIGLSSPGIEEEEAARLVGELAIAAGEIAAELARTPDPSAT